MREIRFAFIYTSSCQKWCVIKRFEEFIDDKRKSQLSFLERGIKQNHESRYSWKIIIKSRVELWKETRF